MSKILLQLEQWYKNQCDGDWEHEFGIKIENIDNPGWKVSIPLERTALEFKPFKEVTIERSETDWVQCIKSEGKFNAYGRVSNLNEILELFIAWVNSK